MIGRAREFRTAGRAPAPPRPAATVVLVRGDPLQVLLLRRATGLAFAPGLYAFPGGSLDRVDEGETDGAPDPLLRFRRAAVRETHEETGIRLDPKCLKPWSIWVTPPFEPRRYETVFFLALAPAADDVVLDPAECAEARWVAPARAAAERLPMLPPTLYTLRELATFASAAHAMDSPRVVRRFALDLDLDADPPRWVETDGREERS